MSASVQLPLHVYKMFYNFSYPDPTPVTGSPPAPFFQRGQCGVSSNDQSGSIMGGADAPDKAWPWAVLVVGHNGFLCGGTIIGSEWVLTAGHCHVGQNFDVIYGHHNLEKAQFVSSELAFKPKVTESGIAKLRLSDPLLFPQNSAMDYPEYDIALMKLSTPLDYSDSVQPVCQPDSNFWYTSICYITGWGERLEHGEEVNRLQQLRVEVVNQTLCRGIHASFGVRNTGGSLCTINLNLAGTTLGDAGGALVCRKNGRYHIVGVASHRIPLLQDSHVDYYTQVSKHAQWISDTILQNS